MADTNDLTLRSYDSNVQAYIDGTPHHMGGPFKAWLDLALSLIPKDSKILELGSGFGRDAAYMQQLGYDVECSDAPAHFVQLLQSKGLKARMLNALKDDLGSGYSMVFANAVLLHFTPEEAATVIDKIHAALNDKGVFAFSVKRGDGDGWTSEKLGAPRYFNYWQPGPLKELLVGHGFEWLAKTESHTSHNDADWLQVITRKLPK